MCEAAPTARRKTANPTAVGDVLMPSRRQTGFTYLMLLWWVAISSVLLTALSQNWLIDSRREKEADLLFKGGQIKRAIEAYSKVPLAEGKSTFPTRLEELLEDSRLPMAQRHLRRLWPDPITGGPWGLIKGVDGGIRGVYSTSLKKPLRMNGDATTYAEWRFEAAAGP